MTDIVCKVGHKENDRQHEELELLIGQVNEFCLLSTENYPGCGQCPEARLALCRKQANDIVRRLLKFVSQHFRYEEDLMRKLPDNETCRGHVRRHQKAHAEISTQISNLASQLGEGDPYVLASKIQTLLANWTGAHTAGLDRCMIDLHGTENHGELDEDAELALLLDRQISPEPTPK